MISKLISSLLCEVPAFCKLPLFINLADFSVELFSMQDIIWYMRGYREKKKKWVHNPSELRVNYFTFIFNAGDAEFEASCSPTLVCFAATAHTVGLNLLHFIPMV